MVKATTIRQSNARFASEYRDGLVCVFAGATSGIGASTLERMALMLQAPTFYVVGRSAARFASQRAKLESLNPSCKVVFLEAEVSLLSDVDAVCRQITAAEQKVDCLYMSPGMIPLNFGAPITLPKPKPMARSRGHTELVYGNKIPSVDELPRFMSLSCIPNVISC
ncbi:hypothetical protein VTN00DRAFT_3041 [Thermoascus crustaceus]|uniref:uncharacterized protein n=1 Tax=Thermoascus crustaceus TaxID=5088 RepID=UPI0037426A56